MKNFLEKSFDLGLGLLMYSREKVEELVEELVNKGEVERKDARQFANDLIKRGEDQRGEFKNLIHDEVSKALNLVGVARKDDLVSKDEISQIVREQVLQVLKEQGMTKDEPA
jgi:polyhydroxyalkanoate synthesis regulator phasin